MLTETRAPRERTAAAVPWALATGIAGLLANVLLVLFFLLAEPFGVSGPLAGEARRDYSWLGPANDLVIVIQFLTFIPVALALRRWLPRTRPVRAATAAAVGAMIAIAILQLLLVVGALDFDVQVVLVVVAFLPVYGWVLTVSSTGHRHCTLPRPVTRFGLMLGASYPVGLIIAMAGLIFSWGSATQFAYLLPGSVIAAIGWLGLPVWPLLTARLVFTRPPLSIRNEKGMR